MLSDMDAWKAADEDTETLHETPPNATTTLSLASRSLLNDYTDLLPCLEFFIHLRSKRERWATAAGYLFRVRSTQLPIKGECRLPALLSFHHRLDRGLSRWNSYSEVEVGESSVSHKQILSCYAPFPPVLSIAIPMAPDNPLYDHSPLTIRERHELLSIPQYHHIMHVELDLPHLRTNEQRLNPVAAEGHIIAFFSHMRNVDRTTIMNVVYLVEFDGPDYIRRSMELLRPFR